MSRRNPSVKSTTYSSISELYSDLCNKYQVTSSRAISERFQRENLEAAVNPNGQIIVFYRKPGPESDED